MQDGLCTGRPPPAPSRGCGTGLPLPEVPRAGGHRNLWCGKVGAWLVTVVMVKASPAETLLGQFLEQKGFFCVVTSPLPASKDICVGLGKANELCSAFASKLKQPFCITFHPFIICFLFSVASSRKNRLEDPCLCSSGTRHKLNLLRRHLESFSAAWRASGGHPAGRPVLRCSPRVVHPSGSFTCQSATWKMLAYGF